MNAQTSKLNQKISRRLCKFPVFQGGKNNSGRFPGVLDTLFMHVIHGPGSILLWQHYDNCYVVTVVDDVMFGYNGLHAAGNKSRA